MRAPPKIANQTKLTPLGIEQHAEQELAHRAPLEMRAMNVPTKGAHEIHHAQ